MQTITRHLRLDWVDGKPELALPSNADAGPMVVPPQVEIEALHKLAVMGKMRDIKAQTEHLVALDARYRPFADKPQKLARTYQSQRSEDRRVGKECVRTGRSRVQPEH